MVKLDRIYTRGGDGGETSLADGTRVAKSDCRIVAIGDVDEAGAAIGLARTALAGDPLADTLARIQNDLFDLGADLATPGDDPADGKLRIAQSRIDWLEAEIDRLNTQLPALESFVLRGGAEPAARLHFACTVVRRAERSVVAVPREAPLNPAVPAYLNRLSDLLFVMARIANGNGRDDILWKPGAGSAA